MHILLNRWLVHLLRVFPTAVSVSLVVQLVQVNCFQSTRLSSFMVIYTQLFIIVINCYRYQPSYSHVHTTVKLFFIVNREFPSSRGVSPMMILPSPLSSLSNMGKRVWPAVSSLSYLINKAQVIIGKLSQMLDHLPVETITHWRVRTSKFNILTRKSFLTWKIFLLINFSLSFHFFGSLNFSLIWSCLGVSTASTLPYWENLSNTQLFSLSAS